MGTRRPLWPLAAAVLAAGVTSCGRGKPPAAHPARATVLVNGRPAVGAAVALHPATGAATGPKPHGTVGADGVVPFETFAPGDGAPAGEYVVTVTWESAPVKDAAGDTMPGPDRLKGKYADPAKPAATVTVADGDNRLPTLDLKFP